MRFPPNVEIFQETHPFHRIMIIADRHIMLNALGDIDYIRPEHIMTVTNSKTLIERIMWAVSKKPTEFVQWEH